MVKKVSALFLCIAMLVSLASCGFEDRLQGFVAAATYMDGKTDLDTHVQMFLKTAKDAKTQDLEDFVLDIVGMSESLYPDYTEMLKDINIGTDIKLRVLGNSAEVSIGWVGSGGGVQELYSVTLVGETIYIGLGSLFSVLGSTADAILPGASQEIEPFYQYDYVSIDISDILGSVDIYGEMPQDAITDYSAIISEISGRMSAVLKENAASVLTDDLESVLKGSGGEYSLSLNTQSFMEILMTTMELVSANSADVADFVNGIVEDIGLSENLYDSVTAQEVREGAQEAIGALSMIKVEQLPEITFDYEVKASGQGDAKRQYSRTELALTEKGMNTIKGLLGFSSGLDVLPEMVGIEVVSDVKIQTAPIAAPTGNIITLEEFMNLTGLDYESVFDDLLGGYGGYGGYDFNDYYDFGDYGYGSPTAPPDRI